MDWVLVALLVSAVILLGWNIYQAKRETITDPEVREMRDLLNRAAQIMLATGPADAIEDSDVLSPRTAVAIDIWIHDHNEYMRREINA